MNIFKTKFKFKCYLESECFSDIRPLALFLVAMSRGCKDIKQKLTEYPLKKTTIKECRLT